MAAAIGTGAGQQIAGESQRTIQPLRIAVWFATLLAAGMVPLRAAQILAPGGVAYYGWHHSWMNPVANLIIFGTIGLVAAAAGRLVPFFRRPGVFIGLFAWMFFLAGSFVIPRLHLAAHVVLATGLAVQASRIASSRLATFARLVRRSQPFLVGWLVMLAAIATLVPRAIESRAVARLGPARGRPNILFLILDTVRSSSMSLYGHRPGTTPRLAAFAARGATFDHAIAPASYTLASHATFFTGRWPLELGIGWSRPLRADVPTLAEQLRAAGYRTGAFSANRIYVNTSYGLDRGFLHFDEFADGIGEMARNAALARTVVTNDVVRRITGFQDILGRKPARRVNAEILDWLSSAGDHPWFAFANYFDAHGPYLPPSPCDTTFWYRADADPGEVRRLRRLARKDANLLTAAEGASLRPAYEGAIACLDRDIGALLDSLQRRGLLDHTIVVITSDHGEEFGEHALFGHGNSLYLESLRVPLVIAYPGTIPAGLRVDRTVSLRDLPRTVMDLAGVTSDFPGHSLRALMAGDTSAMVSPALAELPFEAGLPEGTPISKGEMASLVTDGWQYIRDGAGAEQLFDLRRDPTGVMPVGDAPEMLSRIRPLLDSLRPRRPPVR